MTNHEMAEAMIEKMVEFCRLWEASEAAPEDELLMDRRYFLDYTPPSVIGHDTMLGPVRVVHLEVRVDDELNSMQLIGVFDEDRLVHLTSEVDTNWSEVGAPDPGTGEWVFTHTP